MVRAGPAVETVITEPASKGTTGCEYNVGLHRVIAAIARIRTPLEAIHE